jgi:tetratricopeptide (TPR) repeat protein
MEYTRAEAAYDSARKASPDSAQFLWRLARLYVMRGEVAEDETKEQLFRTAEAYARRCIMADSALGAGHTWQAAALGNIAMFEGSKGKVRLCTDIKNALDRAIALDSTDDVAYSIMGSFYLALGNVSWIERQLASVFLGSLPEGGYRESEAALRRAVTLAPNVIRHRYELGMLYEAEGRRREARETFQHVTELPTLLASDARTKARAAEWVSELED